MNRILRQFSNLDFTANRARVFQKPNFQLLVESLWTLLYLSLILLTYQLVQEKFLSFIVYKCDFIIIVVILRKPMLGFIIVLY